MNCALCYAYQRDKNNCQGCRIDHPDKPRYCERCKMANCTRKKGIKYCFECNTFPCARLKSLDKRYRTKYRMSMIENLQNIKENGIRKFVKSEQKRWKCKKCKGIVSVHRDKCMVCDSALK